MEAADYEKNPFKLERAIACDLMLHAWMLTQSGIPVLYSGDEVGQLNDYSYHHDGEKWDDSRYIHRGNFQWDLAHMRHDGEARQASSLWACAVWSRSGPTSPPLTPVPTCGPLTPALPMCWA